MGLISACTGLSIARGLPMAALLLLNIRSLMLKPVKRMTDLRDSMTGLTDRKFHFVSKALPEDAFGVVSFEGAEGLSKCYQFNATLIADKSDIDLTDVLQHPATFTIHREEGDIDFHGIVVEFEQHQAFNEYVIYKAVLAPKLWWLSLTHHNQVFLNMTLPEILRSVLMDGGLTPNLDFELRLQKDYQAWEYVCQYRESHLNFLSRWMEREGIYYFFEQNPHGEKVILTDTKVSHTQMPAGRTMYYSPPSGLDESRREEVIKSFICRQKLIPRKVFMKDYNYQTPSLEVSGHAEVAPDHGRGEIFYYGDHFFTPSEGENLAQIRAEGLLCREKRFHGESTIPFLRPGYVFELEDHYRSDFNQDYLTIEISHQGVQSAYLTAGLKQALSEMEQSLYYRNTFTVIPAAVQYRPDIETPKARFYGSLNAKIDSAGSGEYAELDEQGRYKVVLPFDLSGRKDGKASAFLRMAQPYTGGDHGMHFPLHKGTEVLLTFIDGDPDRPIISASVPNPTTPSLVKDSNQTQAMITTGGQNKIHIEDKKGTERILMQSPTEDSWLRMGAPNDPPPADLGDAGEKTTVHGKGIRMHTRGDWEADVKKDFIIDGERHYNAEISQQYDLKTGASYEEQIGVDVDDDSTHHDFSSTSPMKGVYVKGKHEERVTDTQDVTVGGKQTITVGSGTGEMRHLTVNGDEKDEIKGKLDYTVDEDATIHYKGKKSETVDEEEFWSSGGKSAGFGGATFDLFLGEQASVFAGSKHEFALGILKLAIDMAVYCMNINVALTLTLHTGINMDIGNTLQIDRKGLEIKQKDVKIENGQLSINGKQFKMENNTFTMI